MKIVRTALLGAAGLVAMSLSAQAAGSTATDTPAFKPRMSTELIQLGPTQRESRRRHVPERESGRRHVQEVEEEKEEEVRFKAQRRFAGPR